MVGIPKENMAAIIFRLSAFCRSVPTCTAEGAACDISAFSPALVNERMCRAKAASKGRRSVEGLCVCGPCVPLPWHVVLVDRQRCP